MAVLAVVIPTFNRPQKLRRCVRALLEDDSGCVGTIYVINDGATPLPPLSADPRLRLLRTASPASGAAAARNVALDDVREDLVALLDDDSVAEPGWARACVSLFERFPSVTAQLGHIRWTGPLDRSPWGRWHERFIPELRQKLYDSRHRRFTSMAFRESWSECFGRPVPADLPGVAAHLSAGNAAVRTAFFREHGAFNTTYRMYDDRELAWRIIARRGLIAYNPSMAVCHSHEPSIRRALTLAVKGAPYQVRLEREHPTMDRALNALSYGFGRAERVHDDEQFTVPERLYTAVFRALHRGSYTLARRGAL